MRSRAGAIVLACGLLAGLAPAGAAQAAAVGSSQLPTWSVVPSPSRPNVVNVLNGISCSSASACTAVGDSYRRRGFPQTLIESWNGSAWSIVPSPSPDKTSVLDAVSCPSVTSCTAVGWANPRGSYPKTLVESWNGSAWTVVPSPSPSVVTSVYDQFAGVSCTSATACMAVGRASQRTLIESWNGTKWSVMRYRAGRGLGDVSCTAANSCLAVGGIEVESWNGTTWSAVSGPKTSPAPDLVAVSCVAATGCTAIGTSGRTKISATWNGSTWSVNTIPGTGGPDYLLRVSCAAASTCTAVGYYQDTTTLRYSTLVEYWDGTAWSLVSSPNGPAKASDPYLYSVSCPTATECLAAGWGSGKTLIEMGTLAG